MEVIVNEEVPLGEVSLTDLEAVRVHGPGEGGIKGDELRRRAREKEANLGQTAAEWMLRQADQIPREFRIYHLVFTAEVREDSNQYQYMVYLYHDGVCWHLEAGLMHADWDAYCRVMKLKQAE